MKLYSKNLLTRRNSGALLGASALMALAGCGGGGSGNFNGNGGNQGNSNSSLTSVDLTALTSDNRLLTFNSRTPGTSTLVSISGIRSGDRLSGIDNRYTPPSTITDFNGQSGLFAIGQNGTNFQLYRLAVTGNTATATAIGAPSAFVNAAPAANSVGFDFNPTVDRIRLIEPTANRDARLNPNTGAVVDFDPVAPGVQNDGNVTYDPSDTNTGKNPDAVAAAYSNPDADAATGTTLYVVDGAQNTLAIQGRADDPTTTASEAVSPNSGRLFTIGKIAINLSQDCGFDISPNGNAAFLSNNNRIYGISIDGFNSGALRGGASVKTPAGVRVIGLAATS